MNDSMNMVITLDEAIDNTIRAIKAGLVPFIKGPPAAGKSAVVRKIADDFGLKLIDLRLSQCDPTDLLGFPQIDQEQGRASYAPMDTFPLEGDEVPEGYNGWLVFFDELTSAPRAVQAACYKPLQEREIGQRKIHSKVAMVAAGNREEDNAIVEPMSTALQSRLIHMQIDVDLEVWLEWAMRNGIDHRITSYLKFKPSMLYTFDPEHTDNTYAAPRTWEYTSKLIKGEDEVDHKFLSLLSGTIGQGVAREFLQHMKIYDKLPSMEEILSRPTLVKVPDEPSVLFALTGAIASRVTDKNLDSVLQFTNRLPREFEIVCLREVFRRVPDIENHPTMKQWIVNNAAELF